MYFAQFYTPSATNPENLIEACGDRSVIILDGRTTLHSMERIAARVAWSRGYKAYSIHKGESFTRCTELVPMTR